MLKKPLLLRRRQESFPDDLDWLDDPAGKDSCQRSRMTFFNSLLNGQVNLFTSAT
jgi:hypothetical protein